MVAKKYPMSKAELIQIESKDQFEDNLQLYCCLFDVEFSGIVSKSLADHPLSRSKCHGIVNAFEDNGRIVRADLLYTTLTEQDFYILRDFYEWDSMRVFNFRRFQKGYLPTPFVKAILKLYEEKTTLKGIAGKEVEYLLSKGMLNACFGMAVTDIVRPEIIYNGDWTTEAADLAEQIEKYNKAFRRFLFYPWGVWVTAHARRALFTGISEFNTDYIYSDTDSIKVINADKHKDYFTRYNRNIITELEFACNVHGIDPAAIRPKTIKGIEKPLGVWDDEGQYNAFKTLGAKRYLTLKNGELSLTVSGLNKKIVVPYLKAQYGDFAAIFDAFNDGLYIPKGQTGKNIHSYLDYKMQGIVTDYTGKAGEYNELSGVHLEAADYSLSIGKNYIEYLKGLRYE